MKEPTGELVELDFYFPVGRKADLFTHVLEHCWQHGGEFTGEIILTSGPGVREQPYSSLTNFPISQRKVTKQELQRVLADKDQLVVKAGVRSAIGIMKNSPEVVAYCGISEEASLTDIPPIAIIGEGWLFSTPGYERQAKKAGRKCYAKFIEICSAVDPDYGAILSENWIPCDYDLQRGQGKHNFTNFFVTGKYGSDLITKVKSLYLDAYTETLPTGLYVSTTPGYNPADLGLDRVLALKRSVVVADILARRLM